MNATIDASAALGAVAPVTLVRTDDPAERRVVEPTDRGTLRTASDGEPPVPPVVQLVRKSAQQFSQLLESGTPAEAAAALTGFTAAPPVAGPGSIVDTYA